MYLQCRYLFWRLYTKTRVQKWGNSLAVRIPKSFAEEAGLERETAVDLSMADGKLIIIPVAKPKPSLTQLLSRITDDNLHKEVDTGSTVGNEIW
jgi:antitoxin MazE